MTRWMCSVSSTSSSAIPRSICPRSTFAANATVFSFLRTDFTFMPSIPVGRTSAQAVTKPESSSTAYSVFAIRVSRGTPRYSAWPATASITSRG